MLSAKRNVPYLLLLLILVAFFVFFRILSVLSLAIVLCGLIFSIYHPVFSCLILLSYVAPNCRSYRLSLEGWSKVQRLPWQLYGLLATGITVSGSLLSIVKEIADAGLSEDEIVCDFLA